MFKNIKKIRTHG